MSVKLQNSGATPQYELKYLCGIGSSSYYYRTYSVNISSYIPDVYQRCTAEDFYVRPYRINFQWYSNSAGRSGYSSLFSLSYNASTGVVSGQSGGTASATGDSNVNASIQLYLYVILHGQ